MMAIAAVAKLVYHRHQWKIVLVDRPAEEPKRVRVHVCLTTIPKTQIYISMTYLYATENVSDQRFQWIR